jgi:hypothetical protein
MALFTITFHEKIFTAQVELADVEKLASVVRKSDWFSEIIVPELGSPGPTNSELLFQCFPLEGLVFTWAGFFGRGGKYMSFTLVKVANA